MMAVNSVRNNDPCTGVNAVKAEVGIIGHSSIGDATILVTGAKILTEDLSLSNIFTGFVSESLTSAVAMSNGKGYIDTDSLKKYSDLHGCETK